MDTWNARDEFTTQFSKNLRNIQNNPPITGNTSAPSVATIMAPTKNAHSFERAGGCVLGFLTITSEAGFLIARRRFTVKGRRQPVQVTVIVKVGNTRGSVMLKRRHSGQITERLPSVAVRTASVVGVPESGAGALAGTAARGGGGTARGGGAGGTGGGAMSEDAAVNSVPQDWQRISTRLPASGTLSNA